LARNAIKGNMGENLAGVHVTIRGHVQGVFFRDSTQKRATALGLTGYVSNLADGSSVEVMAEGERVGLETLIEYLRTGPPRARVEEIAAEWSEYSGRYPGFIVR
jgi:acylphosphatase